MNEKTKKLSDCNEYYKLKKMVDGYIKKHPAPTSEINRINLTKLQQLQKNSTEYKKLRDHIVLSNGGFAMRYVLKYISILKNEDAISELFQEAMIGIIETIDSFNIDFKTSFVTYAYFHVRKRIIDFIKKNKLIRAPRDIAKNMKIVSEVYDTLFTKHAKIPSYFEIKKELGKKKIFLEEDLIEGILLLLGRDSSADETNFIIEFQDQVTDKEITSDIQSYLEASINSDLERCYDDKQKDIIKKRFGINTSPININDIKYMDK